MADVNHEVYDLLQIFQPHPQINKIQQKVNNFLHLPDGFISVNCIILTNSLLVWKCSWYIQIQEALVTNPFVVSLNIKLKDFSKYSNTQIYETDEPYSLQSKFWCTEPKKKKKNHISCILPELYVTIFLQCYVKMFPSNTWLEKIFYWSKLENGHVTYDQPVNTHLKRSN